MQPHGKNDDVGQPDAPELPGTKPSIKGDPWFQTKVWQRNALLGISGRRGPWSCKGSKDAQHVEIEGVSGLGGGASSCRQGLGR